MAVTFCCVGMGSSTPDFSLLKYMFFLLVLKKKEASFSLPLCLSAKLWATVFRRI